MAYGMQIKDSSGNITLDTSDTTVKDLVIYSNPVITSNGTITGITGLTENSIVLVTNNLGDGDVLDLADVEVDYGISAIHVTNGGSGFNIGVRVMEF